jgi:hypothetical protein
MRASVPHKVENTFEPNPPPTCGEMRRILDGSTPNAFVSSD